MDRRLDGIFFRLKREDKWENVCLSDMTEEERESKLKGQNETYLLNTIHILCRVLKNIGDGFDIVRQ